MLITKARRNFCLKYILTYTLCGDFCYGPDVQYVSNAGQ